MHVMNYSFVQERHRFDCDISVDLQVTEFKWDATVRCDGRFIGRITGKTEKSTIPPPNWHIGFLQGMAVFEVENRIKNRDGVDW
jgi:hypothetical protein